jgi:ankyrin repeat protein
MAAWNNDARMIKLLLDSDAELGVQDKNGLTPFLLAAEDGQVDAVKVLKEVDHDGNVSIGTCLRQYPLQPGRIHTSAFGCRTQTYRGD